MIQEHLKNGFTCIPNDFLRTNPKKLNLTQTAKDIKIYLASFNPCFPSEKLIADALDCGIATVKRNIKLLFETGHIRITKSGRKNLYTTLWPPIGITINTNSNGISQIPIISEWYQHDTNDKEMVSPETPIEEIGITANNNRYHSDTPNNINKEKQKEEKEQREEEQEKREAGRVSNDINNINTVKEIEETEEEKAFRASSLNFEKNLKEAKAQSAYINNNEFQEPQAKIYEEIEEVLNESDIDYKEEEDYDEFQNDIDSESLLWRNEPTQYDEFLNE